ncbi:MAG: hypothetical protein DCF30_03175 [Hyphomicrobiales bacterium]|nr:MAG: hypothetical protein DCF30_03175 [Hyphomicrobiales bacterium]
MSIAEHEFGSSSTDIKLAVVEGYLQAFTQALRPHFNHLWYIDAYAGTGERTERVEAQLGSLFDAASPERIERRRGSARIALEVAPHFDQVTFIEKNARHCQALEALGSEFPGRNIEIMRGSAEDELRKLIQGRSWASKRAVVLLDPYGMSVSWRTLEMIQATKAIDVWYLVSLSGLFRQAARDGRALDDTKRAAITRMFGTDAWDAEWYQRTEKTDLFGQVDEQHQRIADVNAIEAYAMKRLSELFPKVLKPLRLDNGRGVPVFSLFFAVSNPHPKAIGLAQKIAGHMLKVGNSSQVRP